MSSNLHPLDVACQMQWRRSRRRRRWRSGIRFLLAAAYLATIAVIMAFAWMLLKMP
jgi:hypothetical protein